MDLPERSDTLAEILGPPGAELYRIWLDLFPSVDCEDKLFQLPFYDRYTWLVFRFSQEEQNGGIDQFLFNSSGDYVEETMEALAAIGASKAHRALEQACELFPDGRPSEEHETRENQVREIHAKFGDRHIDDIIAEGEVESNLAELLLDFRRRNSPTS